jgi:hypothetical protein
MTDNFYGEAVETLQILVSSLGAGLAAWGVINLLEIYDTTERDEIAENYRQRMKEIDLLLQQLFEDKATGRITPAQYKADCAVYDAEMDELWEALHQLGRETEARKRQGLAQIMRGASLAAIAPFIHDGGISPIAEDFVNTMQHDRQ